MFGVQNLNPLTTAQVQQKATPPAGNSSEVIYHQMFDTQTFTSATTTDLNFFAAANADATLTNLPQAGQLPFPQTLQIFDITLDILSPVPVSTNPGATTVVGVLNDLALLLLGSAQRPTWQLNISEKKYGPYSLTTLHGTGGPTGFGWGAEVTSIQYARNEPSPGWTYMGNITIKQQVNFNVVVHYAATATLTGNPLFRVSMFGILNRAVS